MNYEFKSYITLFCFRSAVFTKQATICGEGYFNSKIRKGFVSHSTNALIFFEHSEYRGTTAEQSLENNWN